MEPLPKLVHERLRATTPPAHHPDPDLLTAFIEQSLPERERSQVLNHLAACGACRDVVALTTLQPEPIAASARPARAPWLTLPVLRWGTVGAFAVIAGVAIMLRMEHRQPAPSLASSGAADKVVAQPQPPAAQPSPSPVAAVKEAPMAKVAPQPPIKLASKAPLNNEFGGVGAFAGAAAPSFVSNNAPAVSVAADAALPPSRSFDSVTAMTQTVEVTAADAETPSPATPRPTTEVAELSKAKEPQPQNVTSIPAPPAMGGLQTTNLLAEKMASRPRAMLKLSLPTPRWTISADGALQRSYDSGRTWEKVTIANTSGFRAVSAIGSDVWVGGFGGVVFHSADAGHNWTALKPAAGDATLTADIASIAFTDTQHGTITTTTNEVWSTADAGLTWQKQ